MPLEPPVEQGEEKDLPSGDVQKEEAARRKAHEEEARKDKV